MHLDDDKDILLKVDGDIDTRLNNYELEPGDKEMQIIFENVEFHYTTNTVQNIIPQFTATYEDIKKMKQLKVRNVHV